jgi:hypothetical protein
MRGIDHAEFWNCVAIAPSGCWLWTGAMFKTGYGAITINGKSFRAHRIAFGLANGYWPGRYHVLHSCDNPACCRPDHLHLSTNADNQREKAERGRASRGEGRWSAKLTEEAVRDIRTSGAPYSWGLCQRFAKKYGVAPETIRWVLIGRTWKHVKVA